MPNSSGVVGVLRALLTADTGQFDTAMRKSATVAESTSASITGLGKELVKLTPQAERMAKAFSGDRLTQTANNLVAAVTEAGGASKLIASEQARVNATITQAIAKYTALGKAAPKAMIDLEQATRKVLPPTEDLDKHTSGLDKTVLSLGKNILATAGIVLTAQAAFTALRQGIIDVVKELKTLTLEGAGVADVSENFDHLTASANRSGAALLGTLNAALHNTVPNLQLMKTVNEDLTAGLKLTDRQFSILAKGGFALAQRNATDVATGFEALNDAMLTGRTKAVASITGKINQTAAEDRFAKALGTTREHLSEEGKLEATRAEILRRVELATQRLGEQTDGLDEKVSQAQKSWADFRADLGKTIATSPVIMAALDGLSQSLTDLFGENREEAIRNIARLIDELAIAFVGFSEEAVKAGGFIVKEFIEVKKFINDVQQAVDAVRLGLIALRGPKDVFADPAKSVKDYIKDVTGAIVQTAKHGETLEQLNADQRRVDESTATLSDKLEQIRLRMVTAAGATTAHGSALNKAAGATRGLTDDTESLTQASAEEKAALKAYKEALESISASSKALAPVQQETIRLLMQASIGSDTIAKSMRLTTDEVNRAMTAIQLYGRQYGTLDDALAGVTRSVDGLTTAQKVQIKSGLDAGLSVDEVTKKVNDLNPALHLGTLAVKQFGDALKDLDDIRADVLSAEDKALGNFQSVLEAESSARAQLAQTEFNKQQQIATALGGIAERRAHADIELAKMRGASIQEIYSLERREARVTLAAVLGGIAAETSARELEVQAIQDAIAATQAAGIEITPEQERGLEKARADLEAQRDIAKVQTQDAVEDFNLAQRSHQEAIRRTTNVWIRAWDQMRSTSDSTIASVASGIADLEHQTAGNLGTLLFGLRDVDTKGLKRAAEDAKRHFEEIKRSGKATAADIHDAFNDWREKEEEANNGFAYRFKNLWHGIKSTILDVLNDVLKYFTETFIAGLIKGIGGAKLGQQLGSQFAGAIPGMGGGGGGGGSLLGSVTNNATSRLIGKIPGIGGGAVGSAAATTGAGAAASLGTSAGVAAGVGAGAVVAPPAFLAGAPALGATGGGVMAGSAAAPGAGGGMFLTNPAFWTNPWTAVGAAAVVGGVMLYRHLTRGKRGNDARDKDLAQFAGFDNATDKKDAANPPGFHGLDRLLTRHKHHELFTPFVTAKSPGDVRKKFAPIQAFVATLGRNVKSFHVGGVIMQTPMNALGEVLIKALPGEAVLTPETTESIGGARAVNALNAKPSVAKAAGAVIGGLFHRRTRKTTEGIFGSAIGNTGWASHGAPSAARKAVGGFFGGIFHTGGVVGARRSGYQPELYTSIGRGPAQTTLGRAISHLIPNPAMRTPTMRISPALVNMAGLAHLAQSAPQFAPMNAGGFLPPGVVQPSMPQGPGWNDAASSGTMKPSSSQSAQPIARNTYITVEGVLDASNFNQLLREHGFDEISQGLFLNRNNLTTNARKAINR